MIKRAAGFKSESLQAAEIFGNVSVAWFSAGVIVPILGEINDAFVFGLRLSLALGWAGFSFWLSLKFAKRGKK